MQVVSCGTDRQQQLSLDDTYHFLLLLHWIEKRSSHGHLLKHMESSGAKIMTRRPIVRQLCVERN